jgi:hypothetical protein
MSAKFVAFINPRDRKPILINPAHVRTAHKSGSEQSCWSWIAGKGKVMVISARWGTMKPFGSC